MAKSKRTISVPTPIGTFSFPSVFTAKADKEDATKKPKFEITVFWTPKDLESDAAKATLAAMQEQVILAGMDFLNTTNRDEVLAAFKTQEGAEKPLLRTPFRRDWKTKGWPEGSIGIAARTTQKPGVVDANVKTIIDQAEIYGGARGLITVTAFGYDQKGNKGVTFALNNVQKAGDGPRLDNRPSAESEFKAVLTAAPSTEGLI